MRHRALNAQTALTASNALALKSSTITNATLALPNAPTATLQVAPFSHARPVNLASI